MSLITKPTQHDLNAALEHFWHPVCTLTELDAAQTGVLGVRLLERDLAVARLATNEVAVVADRCPHRSARLSVGCVSAGTIRCAYHGWRWGTDGQCVEIPSAPDLPIPSRARVQSFAAEIRHGLVWVRIGPESGSAIPPLPAAADPPMRLVAGEPYTWPTSAPRRVENFVDLAHFAWVHDGTLGKRDEPIPPLPLLRREGGEIRFEFDPPPPDRPETTALVGRSRYRIVMPTTVNIEFTLPGSGARRHLWMTASPLDAATSKTFWFIARSDGHEEPDEVHLAFQDLVLAEDEPVVCNQVPPEIPLDPTEEISVRADRVSVEYRRWLVELAVAARTGSIRIGDLSESAGT